ncbi:MAG: cation-efflux pump [Candidatus Thermoplasmatota archaeon]|nr:cation-efflux pump [Candidatus Thermoplasmatota archaeon]
MMKLRQHRFIPEYGNSNDPNVRAKYGYLEAIVSIVGNIFLFLLKLLLGIYINSIALIADGVHSLSDVFTSGVVILGFRFAKKQPDKDHPYGHGRVEYIATIIIAIILIFVGISFIQQSIERILNLDVILHQEFAFIISGIVLISALGKELMARYSNAIAKKINSDVLKADAWHHRSDAISSIGVAIGIIAARYGFPIFDPIFGIVVSIIIIYVGISLVRTTSDFLIGHAPDEALKKTVESLASTIENIIGIHDLSLHDYGTTKILTVHVEIDSTLPLEKAHAIADSFEKKINQETNYSTIIHLDPADKPANGSFEKQHIIETILRRHKQVKSFHKVRIIHDGSLEIIKMHLIVDKNMPVQDSHHLCHGLKVIFEKKYGHCDVDIHFEPCSENCISCKISCSKRQNS